MWDECVQDQEQAFPSDCSPNSTTLVLFSDTIREYEFVRFEPDSGGTALVKNKWTKLAYFCVLEANQCTSSVLF